MVTPAVKREAVAHVRSAFELSERRACRMIGCVRMTVRYRSRRPADTELRERLRALAHERRRFGYRRLHVLLRREGFIVNHKRLFRIYREERLLVRRPGGRKRALGTRAPMLIPEWPNDRWSLDFVADQFIDGRRLRILVVVDDCTRECLALVADSSISGIRVARELDRLLGDRGRPKTIVSDNGTELTSSFSRFRWGGKIILTRLNDSAFDAQLEGVYFGMWTGSTSVRCLVTHAALTDKSQGSGQAECLDVFHEYRSEIESLASAKYDAGKIKSDGLPVVHSPDPNPEQFQPGLA